MTGPSGDHRSTREQRREIREQHGRRRKDNPGEDESGRGEKKKEETKGDN